MVVLSYLLVGTAKLYVSDIEVAQKVLRSAEEFTRVRRQKKCRVVLYLERFGESKAWTYVYLSHSVVLMICRNDDSMLKPEQDISNHLKTTNRKVFYQKLF